MSLENYRKKRNFKTTPEPPALEAAPGGTAFVVQKHAASRLHYDLRLEIDGVLKSWAVPKGPSLDPAQKRLAVLTEDHPLAYKDFEGVIPEGEYGAGKMIVWDRGSWAPAGDPAAAFKKGKIDFELRGEKLKGRWALVRLRSSAAAEKENWLLIKGRDDCADSKTEITAARPESVLSGKKVEEVE